MLTIFHCHIFYRRTVFFLLIIGGTKCFMAKNRSVRGVAIVYGETPYTPIVANLAALGVSWGPEHKYVANFCMGMFIVPLHYWMPIRAIDPVCPRAICRCVWRCSLPGHCAPVIFHQETVTTFHGNYSKSSWGSYLRPMVWDYGPGAILISYFFVEGHI